MTSDIKTDKFYNRIPEAFDIEAPMTNLPLTFATVLAKPNDKKASPIPVVDLQDYIRLGITVRKLVSKVNFLSSKIHDMAIANMSKTLPNMIGEIVGKETIPAEEDVATIMQWHKDTFPKATCAGQLEKWEEERKEFDNAIDPTEKLKELVDMFIVACAMMRFNVPRGAACMTDVCALREHFNFSFFRWKVEIAEKMRKNRARKWEYLGGGNYHHVKGVED